MEAPRDRLAAKDDDMKFVWLPVSDGTALGWDVYFPSRGELLAAGYVVDYYGVPWDRIDYG